MPAVTPLANMATRLTPADYTLSLAGENAFILYLNTQVISPAAAQQIALANSQLSPMLGQQLLELLPSYASLLIVFNPLQHSHLSIKPLLEQALTKAVNLVSQQQGKQVELPVWYSEQSGPDLAKVAQDKNLSINEVIALHSSTSYQVYAIGFAPGFAYLGELPEQLAVPRLSSPRPKVPAGAVAIADRQTAVYPAASPGGWHLLGLCPIAMFNAWQEPAMPVAVGDQVKFVPITERDFTLLGGVL
ncbi:hypothetical protein GCM10010919_32380 [Alishewanella longhuensis]|uniref:Carboxyltransferase domain-containing protein n=1 Tax=Alishewanella longhuensis TaxID=1091037 RepID=A0ABQ3L4H4_9ALTE|nr:5-oxoprolinase subunit PxpB [Alishewanella longhuensis]GHG77005.1 hypothetical protein GCM10010919_32380 [Alishewanella longhuensis]